MAEQTHILLLNSKRPGDLNLTAALEHRGYHVQVATSVPAALELAAEVHPHVLILDAIQRSTNAERICRQLRTSLNGTRIVLLLAERVTPSDKSGADVTLQLPFTARKVINTINHLLPAQSGEWLRSGPIELNLSHRRLCIDHREVTLTPKQSRLLEVLMRHEGEIVTRKSLIREVWETDFTDDTRTLDVHISWLRGVLADDPTDRDQLTRYLKTVRGQGYRLQTTPRR